MALYTIEHNGLVADQVWGIRRTIELVLVALLGLSAVASGPAVAETLRLATTTSTDNSGLLRYLLPKFEAVSGIRVAVISVGTGKALKLGENGDVDVILVHSRPDEDRFVNLGYGVNRRDVMYNDFVVVGPASDPAGIRAMSEVMGAFLRISASGSAFVSRGDDSGTHKMEMRMWNETQERVEGNPAYLVAGRGMGAVLLMASELRAYTLTDRASWYALEDKLDLEMLVEGDARLLNPYGVIAINPARHDGINHQGAIRFIEWLTSPVGQDLIAGFRIDGRQCFFPASGSEASGSR